MCDVVLKRGMERVEVESAQVTTEILRRTFRVSCSVLCTYIECVWGSSTYSMRAVIAAFSTGKDRLQFIKSPCDNSSREAIVASFLDAAG